MRDYLAVPQTGARLRQLMVGAKPRHHGRPVSRKLRYCRGLDAWSRKRFGKGMLSVQFSLREVCNDKASCV